MLAATIILLIMFIVRGPERQVCRDVFFPIILSSLVGVGLGDDYLFVSKRRIGPRWTEVLFAANLQIAPVFGWMFLAGGFGKVKIQCKVSRFCQHWSREFYSKRRDLLHVYDEVTPYLWIVVGARLLVAFGEVFGILMRRSIILSVVD